MTIKPLLNRILIKIDDYTRESTGGILIATSKVDHLAYATVVAIGKGIRLKNGRVIPHDVNPGDRIIINRYAGGLLEVGDEAGQRIVLDTDILGIVDD